MCLKSKIKAMFKAKETNNAGEEVSVNFSMSKNLVMYRDDRLFEEGKTINVPSGRAIVECSSGSFGDVCVGNASYAIQENKSNLYVLNIDSLSEINDEFSDVAQSVLCKENQNDVSVNLRYFVSPVFEFCDEILFVQKYQNDVPVHIYKDGNEIEPVLREIVQSGVSRFLKGEKFKGISLPIDFAEFERKFNAVENGNYCKMKAINEELEKQNYGIRLKSLKLNSIEIV